MHIFRLTTTIGVVSLFFASSAARADKDFRASSGPNEVIAVVAMDNRESASALNIVSTLGDSAARTEPDSFLNSGLDIVAEAKDLHIVEPEADADAAGLTLAGPGKVKPVGIRDVAAPAGMLLLGTALTSFAFLTRRHRRHSRRSYFSRHGVVALPPSKIPRTSPSADSCEPNLHENTGHSSPRIRLA